MICCRLAGIFLLSQILLSLGCNATPYQPLGRNGGYSEIRQSENVFRVSFRGNGFTTESRAYDFAVRRAADLTLQHGFTHFDIVNQEAGETIHEVSTPTTVQSDTFYTENTSSTSQTINHGGTSFFTRPYINLLVVCSNEKTSAASFNATMVIESMANRVKASLPYVKVERTKSSVRP